VIDLAMTARRKRPPQVGTIGSTIAAGLKMWISCDAIGCRNNADVDLLALRDQLGADYRIADFVARSLCSKCGARWPQLSVRVSLPYRRDALNPAHDAPCFVPVVRRLPMGLSFPSPARGSMQYSRFWDAFLEGLTAPALLYAEPPPYWSYAEWYSIPQTFSMVGSYWSEAASHINDGSADTPSRSE